MSIILCSYLFSQVVDDPGQCFCYHFGVPAEFLNIYMRPADMSTCKQTVREIGKLPEQSLSDRGEKRK